MNYYKNKIEKINISDVVSLILVNKHLFALLILLGFGFFFAFYNFENRYLLGDETVREAAIGIQGARTLQAPLMGAFSSAGQFTWGPWFYYQLIVFHLLIPSLYSGWIYLGIAYILSIIILYRIGIQLKDKNYGIILATLGTFSPALIFSATHLTFPNLITFFALLSVYLFIKIIKSNVSYWWSFAFGIILGICINIHYQAASLLVLPLIMLAYKRKKIKYFISFSIGLFFTFLPTLLFELTNNWFNTKHIIYYYFFGKNAIYVPNRWLFYVRDFWPGLWSDVIGTPAFIGLVFMLFVAFVLAFEFYKKKLSTPILLLAVAFFIDFILLRYYWGERLYIYFTFLRPFIFIFTGYVIYFIYKNIKFGKFLSFALLLIIIVLTSSRSINLLKSDTFNKEMYSRVEIVKEKYPGKKFMLYTCSKIPTGTDPAVSKSILFVMEKEGLIDKNGIKLGIEKERCIDRGLNDKILSAKGIFLTDPKKYPQIENTDLYDFSLADEDRLENAGWEEFTFDDIYDSTVKWWYEELR